MRFVVYQVSRVAAARRTKTAWATATRGRGPVRAGRRHGRPPRGEVAWRRWRCRPWRRMFQRDAKTACRPDALPARCHHRRPPPAAALRHRARLLDTPRTTIVACVLQGNAAYWAHCGDSRLYLVRAATSLRTRDHSYTELQETLSAWCPWPSASTATCCSPAWAARQSRWSTPPARCAMQGDRVLLFRRPVGQRQRRRQITEQLATRPISDAVPGTGGRRCARPAQERQRHRAAVEWEAPRTANHRAASDRALGDEVFASTIQASMLGDGAPTNWTTPRSSVRSARSTRPSSARRSANVEVPSGFGARRRLRRMTDQCMVGRQADADARGASVPATPRSVLGGLRATKVLCTASVEERAAANARQRRRLGHGRIRHAAARHAHPRRPRGRAGKQSGRTQEIQRLIGRSLRACSTWKALGERTHHLDCDVLQADGGTRTARHHRRLRRRARRRRLAARQGRIAESPIRDAVAAGVGGHRQGTPLLDLDYIEDSACDTDMNVVMTGAAVRRGAGHGRRARRSRAPRWTRCCAGAAASRELMAAASARLRLAPEPGHAPGAGVEQREEAQGAAQRCWRPAAGPGRAGDLGIAEADEPHVTFIENALAKARHAAGALRRRGDRRRFRPVRGRLGGAPGVVSALCRRPALAAGPGARKARQDAANNARCSEAGRGTGRRGAHFVCTLVARAPRRRPEPLIAVGALAGEILARRAATGRLWL